MNNQKNVHILVEGRVQGVGFRYFVKNIADQTGITGWVRNLSDDRVEIFAQGDAQKLDGFIAVVRAGHTAAMVTNMSIDWHEPDLNFTKFSIAPTV